VHGHVGWAGLNERVRIAWRELSLVSVAVLVLLVAFSGRYGYHRDELYFLVIGGHPAWGYADQPPLAPLLAHAMDVLAPGSLVALRLPPAVAAAGCTMLAGLSARELGASRAGQLLASLCMGVGAITFGAGHLAGTTIFDMLCQALVVWLALVAVGRDDRAWLVAGVVAGIGLEVKTLMGFLLLGLAAGVLVAGPRRVLRSPWLWGGVAAAAALGVPNLLWQAAHDWPQLAMARAIAEGSSGTSSSAWVFVPFQLFLVSPLLCPVWIAGLVRLLRSPALRPWRFVGVAYVVLLVVFVATAAKPYYLAGLFPVLLGAGAPSVVDWARGAGRRVLVGAALVLSLVVDGVLFLPVVPPDALADTPVVDVNYDAGEQVGWPAFARTVTEVVGRQPEGAVVLTGNYGELGALARYAPGVPAYSGHNGLATLGPPPEGVSDVVAVGFDRATLRQWFTDVAPAATIHNGVGLDNDEQGATVWTCSGRRAPWATLWPDITHLG
jgi:hypothetical protein